MPKEEKAYVSREKFEELQKELEELKTVKRKEIAEQLEFAKSLGDLSENAEYQEARENQANLEERILKITDVLKRATIISDKRHSYADVGSQVTIQEEAPKGEETSWHIVGSEESDFSQKKISNESPLGAALIGKKVGDVVGLSTPRGKKTYTILKIS